MKLRSCRVKLIPAAKGRFAEHCDVFATNSGGREIQYAASRHSRHLVSTVTKCARRRQDSAAHRYRALGGIEPRVTPFEASLPMRSRPQPGSSLEGSSVWEAGGSRGRIRWSPDT